jgi:nickel/cobalt exporter
MRRALLAALALALLGAPAAAAHPLGNFSVNHLAVVSIGRGEVDVRWILDQAEIPTFQERGRAPADVLAAKRSVARRGLALRLDGRPAALRPVGDGRISFPAGQGGLRLTRVELRFRAARDGAARVELHDGTFAGRVGWRDIVVRPAPGTAVRSSAPASEPTHGLRVYPQEVLGSPADRRAATFSVRPGAGTVDAPGRADVGPVSADRGAGGFAAVFDDAAAGKGVLILFLLAAFGWGALHALSPGHGKSMVAAYLVGTRGRPRDAVTLGATVTVTHTIGVFALGLVALSLSDFILPEDLYPWLNLVSGCLVLAVGLGVLRSRVRKQHEHHHHHDHDHGHDHPHDRRSIIALGASAGLIPCPSALVVLLGAIAQAQIALGLLLIVAFSAGLATTLTTLGLAVVWTTRRATRFAPTGRAALALRVLPTASAVVICFLGAALTLRALPTL